MCPLVILASLVGANLLLDTAPRSGPSHHSRSTPCPAGDALAPRAKPREWSTIVAMIHSRSSGRSPVKELVLHWLRQPVEEGVHQGPSLPAAVRGKRLKVDGEVGDGVVALTETQQLSSSLCTVYCVVLARAFK